MAEPIVFILGAGASVPYGLPTGKELKHQICNKPLPKILLDGMSPVQIQNFRNEWDRFVRAFKGSGQLSIDRFLHKRSGYSEIGKLAISYCINSAEVEAEDALASDWMEWLYSKFSYLYPDLSDWPISFVTFNYDRLLEASIATMQANSKGVSFEDSYEEVIKKLNIYHVYGQLDDWPDQNPKWAAGCSFHSGFKNYIDFSKGIKVIGEEREHKKGEKKLQDAKDWISKASTRIFLGFGFDEDNCNRIGLGRVNAQSNRGGRWVSTAYGLLAEEREHCKRVSSMELVLGKRDFGCLELMLDQISI
ncbi:MAG: SIR2 family protein [Phycisphaerales bacterium]|nr:SIR2 family protein [Phycisphaerales bacterium]